MELQVETRLARGGNSEPVSFRVGIRTVHVSEILDRWFGADHAYFKLAADDGAHYIVRHGLNDDSWHLHFFHAGSP